MVAPRQLVPKKLISGINQAQIPYWVNSPGSSCLGGTIWCYLGSQHTTQLCRQWMTHRVCLDLLFEVEDWGVREASHTLWFQCGTGLWKPTHTCWHDSLLPTCKCLSTNKQKCSLKFQVRWTVYSTTFQPDFLFFTPKRYPLVKQKQKQMPCHIICPLLPDT